MVLKSISYMVGLPSIWSFSGRDIRDHIPALYINDLPQSCRGASYYFIWNNEILCDFWIYRSILFWSGEKGYVYYIFIPPFSYINFFHFMILVIDQELS